MTVFCRVDNPDGDGDKNSMTASVELSPKQSDTFKVTLARGYPNTLSGKLIGMNGYPFAPGGWNTINPRNITQLLIFVDTTADHEFEIDDIRASGSYTPATASVTDANPFFPFIDAFGQYRHKDWPGKVHSVAEFEQRRKTEAKEMAATPGPKDWCQYGGWAAGPQGKATGYFRTEKLNGKWWLVDPDGHLFFSHGIDTVMQLDTTPIDERGDWFADFPGTKPEFDRFLTSRHAWTGHYAGRRLGCFSFAGANLARKYGLKWETVYPEVVHRRLRSWGLNTLAAFSDKSAYQLRLTPYTDLIVSGSAKRIEGWANLWGKFPDVFDPSFAEVVRSSVASRKEASAGDPWCIGYFSDNELPWGDEISLALGALKSPPEQAAKKVFAADLRTKYGDIPRLNQAWGTTHVSWDAFLLSTNTPNPETARDDLAAFYTKTAETYFRVVRDAIKTVAPNQLYLGCRFALVADKLVNPRAAAAAAKYCDVVSFNLYCTSVADFRYAGCTNVPIISGEFHFGALDRGMFHPGAVPVANQTARAQAYKDYVRGALRHPLFVGVHWFQFQDEPVVGRVADGENYAIGFVDVADTPYHEIIGASREVGANMYQIRMAK